jgi:diguanylate cyclase (GGDEF)-like protein
VCDARVYAVTASGLELLTRDHTLSQSRDPELEAIRVANPTLDFVLRWVGSEDRFAIEVTERACAPGEVLALCTPNVCKVLGDELGKWLARGLDAPAAVVRHMESHEPRLPAALAMIFPSRESAEVPRPERPEAARWLEPDSVVVLYAPDERLERRRYPLGPAVTTVGRRGDNDIVFDHESISRRHARLERRADGVWLVDESTNGTLVNGDPVREGRLRLHDRIMIGKVLVVLSRSNVPFEIVETVFTDPIDGLTGAHSRYYLPEQIGRELERARHAQRPLSLVRLDIVRFKQINDTFGYPAGDEVLRAITQIARRHVRPGNVLARYAGDELAVLLPGTDREGAAALADALRAELAAHAFDAAGSVIQGVTVWVGVAQASEESLTAEDLVRAAAPKRAR